NKDEGWCAGDGGIVLHTLDGGQSWQQLDSGVRVTLNDLSTVDLTQRLWLVGAHGVVLRSENGGLTRDPVLLENRFDGELRAVVFQGTRGLIAGDGGALFLTEDEGASFRRVDAGAGAARWEDLWLGGPEAFVLGELARMRLSVDGGNNWSD